MMIFRRRIGITSQATGSSGEARAALEDDFHHFRVRIAHERGHVVQAQGWAVRHPYSTCPLAAGQLSRLIGMQLESAANSVARIAEPREQCTHLLDLAGLAIAAAANLVGQRWYDAAVPRRIEGRTRATLHRDRVPMLVWDLQDTTIQKPVAYQDVSLREGMSSWAQGTLTPQEAEAALVLRRCALISLGRTKDLDAQIHAEPTGRCFVQQPQRAVLGRRMVGSMLDFTDRAGVLCEADREWLAFQAGSAS
jgi:hypothetical protein